MLGCGKELGLAHETSVVRWSSRFTIEMRRERKLDVCDLHNKCDMAQGSSSNGVC
jgi:hypothetical protein